MSEKNCTRTQCEKKAGDLASVPWGGALGEEIKSSVCSDCWTEWLDMEVKVINELRLNFMDPKSQETLTGHLRKFLNLSGADELDLPDLELPPEAD